ncbi:DNA-directed RNA polymerase specialized sigma24 family protein [Lachnospiraceae bacterium PFB1-21]
MKKKYYLTGADGKDYEVTEEVFRTYKHSIWNENSQYRRERKPYMEFKNSPISKVVSLSAIFDNGGYHRLGNIPDFTDELIDSLELEDMLLKLNDEIRNFSVEEFAMYQHLFVLNLSERDYSKLSGIPRKTISYRKQKLLRRLRQNLNISI